jgi:uncharacterized protein YggE
MPSEESSRRSVTVTGVGTAGAQPDVLRLDLGVEGRGRSVDAALGGANRALEAVLATLREAGVAASDLRTSDLAIHPQYDREGRAITGYVATNSLQATLRDLPGSGALITAAASAGGDASRIHGVRFDLDDPTPLLVRAREAAIADARARAEVYAAAAGRSVGEVLRIEELPDGRPAPVRAARMMAMAEAAGPVPVEGGTHEVTASVSVEWALG